MNNTEVIFKNVELRILKEIKEAHYSIFVSVAWFTNKKLFNALLEKAKNNCYVSIIIQLDDINLQCGIDYNQIKIGRSECFKISKNTELLHDKFCVIDFQKVITGSYNWTYKASHNSENILILNDPSVATQYISRFEQQKAKFRESNIQQKSPPLSTKNNIIDNSKTSHFLIPDVVDTSTSNLVKCLYCQKEINHSDEFCPYCGKLSKGDKMDLGELRVVVICKSCLCKQKSAFLDASNTKFCTFCGSNDLEWKLYNRTK